MKSRKAELIMLIITIVLLIANVGIYLSQDRTAPAFLYTENNIVYREGTDESALLDGIRATDNRDGDVTERIVVDSIIPLLNDEEAKVFYVVSDLSGNVAKFSRIVRYKADSDKKQEGADGSILANAPVSTEDTGSKMPEEESMEMESTEESMTEEEPTTEAAGREGFPVLKLTANEARLSVGDTFSCYNYIESATDDKDSRADLFRRINVQGQYDTSVPGEYELTIFVVDSDGNRSNREKLTLIIE